MGSTPKKIKLKRCPFCGGKAHISTSDQTCFGKQYHISCGNCLYNLSSYRIDTVAKLWNTRKVDEAEDSFVEVGGVWIRKVKEEVTK